MSEAAHHHPIRGRLNARLLSASEDLMDRVYAERKRRLLAGLSGTVVELGPGAGANCRHYPRGLSVIGIEPNVHAHEALRARARERGVDLEVRALRGERLDVPSESADSVVCTLVLCSVDDPDRVLAEVLRVLRPGGRFLYIEHVAAPRGTWLRRAQRLLRPPWSFCFEGCRPDRETDLRLEKAGFSSLGLERFRVRSPLLHLAPHVAGAAVK